MANKYNSYKEAKDDLIDAAENRGGTELKNKIHVYVVDSFYLIHDFGISPSTVSTIKKKVQTEGEKWASLKIGGYDRVSDKVSLAWLTVGEKGGANKFDAPAFNKLHNQINALLQKRGRKLTAEKGHLFSSAVAEGAYVKGHEEKDGTTIFKSFPEYKEAYDESSKRLYRNLGENIRHFFETKRNVTRYTATVDQEFVKNYSKTNAALNGEYVVFIHPQSEELNGLWSRDEKRFKNYFDRALQGVLNLIGKSAPDMDSSPSFFKLIGKILDSKFLHKKFNFKSTHRKSSDTITLKSKTTIGKEEVAIPPKLDRREYEAYSALSVNLITLLNESLHDYLRDHVMGDGSETEILNYRTGRFAHSAHVRSVIQTRNDALMIFYSYMRNPYGVFEYPGGPLAKPFRDPRYLIDRSIREIATGIVGRRFNILTERR